MLADTLREDINQTTIHLFSRSDRRDNKKSRLGFLREGKVNQIYHQQR